MVSFGSITLTDMFQANPLGMNSSSMAWERNCKWWSSLVCFVSRILKVSRWSWIDLFEGSAGMSREEGLLSGLVVTGLTSGPLSSTIGGPSGWERSELGPL